MNKKVTLKELVDTGTKIRRQITPNAILSSNGGFPVGEFWDANTIMTVISYYLNNQGGSSNIGIDSINSEHIKDGTIKLVDLSDEVKNEIENKLNAIVNGENVIFG